MNLTDLLLTDNYIETLVENIFLSNIKLTVLEIKNNLIIDIVYNFVHNTYLRNIDLDDNPLRGLQLSAFESLMYKRVTNTSLKMYLKLEDFTCDCTQLWLSTRKPVNLIIISLRRICADEGVPSLSGMPALCLIYADKCGNFNRSEGLKEAVLYCELRDRGFISLYVFIVFIQL